MPVLPPPAHPVLIVNPRSGGGKAERFGLARECRARGIEPLLFQPGDDLRAIATAAVAAGADAIGVAGGGGSQAVVAQVASAHDVPYVYVSAGTRNHFANDLGGDRSDVVGVLDAFSHGSERRIDLARLNGRVFVNNASLGVYAKILQSERYRDAKLETVARQLPELLSPRDGPVDLRFTAPDGTHWDGAHLVLVSNNPYSPPRPGTRGTRERIDRGLLGVVAIRVLTPRALAEIGATERTGALPGSPGSLDFTAPAFTVDATGPVYAALDGRSARCRAAAAVRVAAVGIAGAGDAAGARAGFASTNTTVPAAYRRDLSHFLGGRTSHARRIPRSDPRAPRTSRVALTGCLCRKDY